MSHSISNSEPATGTGLLLPDCIRFTKLHLDATNSGNLSIFGQDRNGTHQQFDLDAFFLRGLDLML